MFCQECGNEINVNSKFCSNCGITLNIKKNEYNVEEIAKYDIVLTDLGKDKALAITVLAEHAGIELKAAKVLADNLPRAIKVKKAVTETEAKVIQSEFTKIGARVVLKYCKLCGKALTEDGNRCGTCGSGVMLITPDTTFQLKKYSDNKRFSGMAGTQKLGSVHCPKCKSQKLQTTIENNTEGNGGGYGTGKGCLGWLLLGPLGLLCGACGSGSEITTTNKTFFICMDCGNKFREAKELLEEKSGTNTKGIIFCIVVIMVGILALLGGEIFMGLAAIILGGLALWSAIFLAPKEIEDIKNNKYEAECYKKQEK